MDSAGVRLGDIRIDADGTMRRCAATSSVGEPTWAIVTEESLRAERVAAWSAQRYAAIHAAEEASMRPMLDGETGRVAQLSQHRAALRAMTWDGHGDAPDIPPLPAWTPEAPQPAPVSDGLRENDAIPDELAAYVEPDESPAEARARLVPRLASLRSQLFLAQSDPGMMPEADLAELNALEAALWWLND